MNAIYRTCFLAVVVCFAFARTSMGQAEQPAPPEPPLADRLHPVPPETKADNALLDERTKMEWERRLIELETNLHYDEADLERMNQSRAEGRISTQEIAPIQRKIESERKELELLRGRIEELQTSTRVFRIANGGDPYEVAQVIKEIIGENVRAAVDSNTGALVIRTTKKQIAQIEELLKNLDVPPSQSKPEEQQIHAYRPTHLTPDLAANVLSQVFRSPQFRQSCTIDAKSGVLYVTASPEVHKSIEEFLAVLDQSPDGKSNATLPPRTLSVSIDFVGASRDAEEPGTLPDRLKKVADALREQEFGGLTLLGHLVGQVREGESFESSSLILSPVDEIEASMARCKIKTQASADPRLAEMGFSIVLGVSPAASKTREQGIQNTRSVCELGISTNTDVPIGDYVVLGAFPVGAGSSDTVLIVIKITTP